MAVRSRRLKEEKRRGSKNWPLWGGIVSSVAIVATLGYLAVQAKQTNNALMANSRQAALEAELAFTDQLVNNPDLFRLTFEGAREPVERARVLAHTIGFIRSREFLWTQYKFGMIDKLTLRSYLRGSISYLNRPAAREIWDDQKQWSDPELAEFLDELLGQLQDPVPFRPR